MLTFLNMHVSSWICPYIIIYGSYSFLFDYGSLRTPNWKMSKKLLVKKNKSTKHSLFTVIIHVVYQYLLIYLSCISILIWASSNVSMQDASNDCITHNTLLLFLFFKSVQYFWIVWQSLHICWCTNDTLLAHMLPVKRCPLLGGKWSFSHHCNALRHIKEMNCSRAGTTHWAQFSHFWLTSLRPSEATQWHRRFSWILPDIGRKDVFPAWALFLRMYLRSSRFKTRRSGVIIGYSDARCCCRQSDRCELECPLQSLMGTYSPWTWRS